MKEINFYCIEEDINPFLYTFLSKIIANNKKAIIYSDNEEKMKKLDDTLWTMKKTDFLPHLLYTDKGAEDTPILLSNTKENEYNANYLLISSYLNDTEFLNKFEKIFYIFTPSNKISLKEKEKAYNEYKKDYSIKTLKKDNNGKWVEEKNYN